MSKEPKQLRCTKREVFLLVRLEVLPDEQLHREVAADVFFDAVADRADDMWVFERGLYVSFTLEAFEHLFVSVELHGEDLDGDELVSLGVGRVVDHAHAACSEFSVEQVTSPECFPYEFIFLLLGHHERIALVADALGAEVFVVTSGTDGVAYDGFLDGAGGWLLFGRGRGFPFWWSVAFWSDLSDRFGAPRVGGRGLLDDRSGGHCVGE